MTYGTFEERHIYIYDIYYIYIYMIYYIYRDMIYTIYIYINMIYTVCIYIYHTTYTIYMAENPSASGLSRYPSPGIIQILGWTTTGENWWGLVRIPGFLYRIIMISWIHCTILPLMPDINIICIYIYMYNIYIYIKDQRVETIALADN